MTITVRGKDKFEVLNRINEIIVNIEIQNKFDHKTKVRKTEGGWQGTVEIFWHKDSYPSHYGTGQQPGLPGGEKNDAVDKIYAENNIKRR